MSLTITQNISTEHKDYVQNKMIAFNHMHFPEHLKGRYQQLNMHVVNEEGMPFGGIVGEFCWNWLEIQYLYVEPAQRKSGYGRALLRKAEELAKEKECDFIKVDTLSFQALDFYLKEGFHIYGRIENAGSFTHYYLKKDIHRHNR